MADERAILESYERRGRTVTPDFIAAIPWHEIKDHPLDPKFVPTLVYMRDVERLTEVYFEEIRRTSTWRNPVIRRFLERWSTEEPLHGELLNRFLGEAGYPGGERWFEQVKHAIPLGYRLQTAFVNPLIARLVGKPFETVHMVFGAINEYSTMNGYARLSALAAHPVLTKLLTGIMAEEAGHAAFYGAIARAQLECSLRTQKISRFFIDKFWGPVGLGTKPKADADQVAHALFGGNEGLRFFDERVSAVIRRFPGFQGLSRLTETVASAMPRGTA